MLAPPRGLALHSTRNPRSAPVGLCSFRFKIELQQTDTVTRVHYFVSETAKGSSTGEARVLLVSNLATHIKILVNLVHRQFVMNV